MLFRLLTYLYFDSVIVNLVHYITRHKFCDHALLYSNLISAKRSAAGNMWPLRVLSDTPSSRSRDSTLPYPPQRIKMHIYELTIDFLPFISQTSVESPKSTKSKQRKYNTVSAKYGLHDVPWSTTSFERRTRGSLWIYRDTEFKHNSFFFQWILPSS